jgi:hypothetical protein
MILLSLVGAIPALGLHLLLWIGLLQGMLSDGSSVSIALWVVFALAFLGSLLIAVLPVLMILLPGLLPQPAAAAPADLGQSYNSLATGGKGASQAATVDDSADESFESADDGEQLFDDEALDDFEDEAEDFDATPKK